MNTTFRSERPLWATWRGLIPLMFLLNACSAVSIQTPVQVVGQPAAAMTVETLGLSETLSGIQSAARGDTMTVIMQGPNQVMLAWRYVNGWGFVFMNCDGKPIMEELESMGWNGAGVQYSDLKDIIRMLTDKGWTIVPATWLPAAVITTIKSYSIAMLETGADTLPSIFFLPVVPDMQDPLGLNGRNS